MLYLVVNRVVHTHRATSASFGGSHASRDHRVLWTTDVPPSVITLWCPNLRSAISGEPQSRATLSLVQWPADPLRPPHDATNFGGRTLADGYNRAATWTRAVLRALETESSCGCGESRGWLAPSTAMTHRRKA